MSHSSVKVARGGSILNGVFTPDSAGGSAVPALFKQDKNDPSQAKTGSGAGISPMVPGGVHNDGTGSTSFVPAGPGPDTGLGGSDSTTFTGISEGNSSGSYAGQAPAPSGWPDSPVASDFESLGPGDIDVTHTANGSNEFDSEADPGLIVTGLTINSSTDPYFIKIANIGTGHESAIDIQVTGPAIRVARYLSGADTEQYDEVIVDLLFNEDSATQSGVSAGGTPTPDQFMIVAIWLEDAGPSSSVDYEVLSVLG